MYRSLLLVCTFVAVTISLMVLQPKLDAPETSPLALQDGHTAGEGSAEQADAIASLATSTRPRMRPLAQEVSQSASSALTLGAETLTVSLAAYRPKLRPEAAADPTDLRGAPKNADIEDVLTALATQDEPVEDAGDVIADLIADMQKSLDLNTAEPLVEATSTKGTIPTAILQDDGTLRLTLLNLSPSPSAPADIEDVKTASDLLALHTVRLGDTIENIAQRYYGDRSKTPFLIEANKDILGQDTALMRGATLRIPQIDAD